MATAVTGREGAQLGGEGAQMARKRVGRATCGYCVPTIDLIMADSFQYQSMSIHRNDLPALTALQA